MLAISEQQLRGWQRQGLIPNHVSFSFSDLIALKTLQKLRENRIPAKSIGRALNSLKKKLSGVEFPLSELKIASDGRSIMVHIAGQKMEALTGQMLFDFETAELSNLKAFPKAVKAKPVVDERQAELWFQRGLDLEETGAPPAEAIAAYTRAVELNPNAAGALVNLGTIYYHQHKYDEADERYRRAIAVDPRYPLAHFNLGNLCDERGLLDEALQHYTTALKLNPGYADAHYNLALLCEQTSDFLNATRHWKAYLKVDPSSSWSEIARRQLERLRRVTVVK
ncbi:MAG: tetratricopeptide repeat protein [Bryobacteraceae bacterium]